MKYFLSLIFIFSALFSFAQIDTGKIYNCKVFKTGFYKTYEEFINNSPSIVKDFNVTQFAKSKSDSTIIAAEFSLKEDGNKPTHIWGFCDGISIYINYDNGNFKNRYWKLEHVGLHSYFTEIYKNIYLIGGPILKAITGALSALSPADIRLMVITEKGKIKYPDALLMKKFLANRPDLFQAFKEEWKPYERYDYPDPENYEPDEIYSAKMDVIKKYLLKLDERSNQ